VLQVVDAARDELETRLDQEKLDVILTSLDAANQRKNAVVLFKEPYCWRSAWTIGLRSLNQSR
jgi:hypothetical protein